MNITIKLLNETDISLYRSLRLKSFKESPLSFSESFEDESKRLEEDFKEELKTIGEPPECFILGAFTDGHELVGFVKFKRDQRSKARHKSMIHAMYVDTAHRNKGIASKLVSELLQKVNQLKGLEQIHLWVLHSGDSASEFYKKCGFESQGTSVKNDLKINDTYVDAEYMVMYLNKD